MQLNYRDRKKYQEGFKEGFKIGIEIGKNLRDVEIISSLLEEDYSNEEISKMLKFPIEKVEEIIYNIHKGVSCGESNKF